jgi:predicted transcriptional regulator
MDNYEDILVSKRVIRVLSVVAEYGELTITELVRKAGIDHLAGDSIVRQLVEFGLLIDEYQGRNRLIKPNFSSYQIEFIKNHGVETQLVPYVRVYIETRTSNTANDW